jgi:tRNA pseudouridine13 synthase
MQPFQPPFDTEPLAGIGGQISARSEDFVVDEVQLYDWSGEGDHLMVRFRKTGMNTQFAVKAIARAAGVDARDIGVAGQKDRWAVTSQWVSIPKRSAPVEEWSLPEGLEVLETAFHNNKLRTGHLSANRFRIVLIGAEDSAENRAREAEITSLIRSRGIANYFGPQRFGRGGSNLDQAVAWVLADRRDRGRVDRFVARMLPSVVQSEHFNRFLARRLEAGRDRLISGEVVRLDGTNRLFAVEDAAAEQERLTTHDIWLTGPMWGAKMRRAASEAAEMELAAAAEMGLDEEGLTRLGAEVDGTRRDLVTPMADLEVSWINADDSGRGAAIVVLQFSLPSGGYATQVAREYCRRSWEALRPVERSDESDDAGDVA